MNFDNWAKEQSLDIEAISERSKETPLIVLFANDEHLEFVQNWRTGMLRLSLKNFLFFSLDEKLHSRLPPEHSVYWPWDSKTEDLADLWITRVRFFAWLIDKGVRFIHSDTDAVWLKNPIDKFFAADNGYDLLVSQGLGHPTHVYDLRQFVVCCGLFYLNPSPALQSFMKEWITETEECGDDQGALNQLLLDKIPSWECDDPYHITINPKGDKQIICSHSMMRGKAGDLNVGLLPFSDFPRLDREEDDDPYVLHVFSRKDARDKRNVMQNTRAWLMR